MNELIEQYKVQKSALAVVRALFSPEKTEDFSDSIW